MDFMDPADSMDTTDTMDSTVQLEPWEADLAAFLRAHGTGNVATRKREAQGFADKLDAVHNSVRLLYYVKFSDHVSRLSITEIFTGENKNNIGILCGSCVTVFASSHPRLRSHQSLLNAKPSHLHQVVSQKCTRQSSKADPLQ